MLIEAHGCKYKSQPGEVRQLLTRARARARAPYPYPTLLLHRWAAGGGQGTGTAGHAATTTSAGETPASNAAPWNRPTATPLTTAPLPSTAGPTSCPATGIASAVVITSRVDRAATSAVHPATALSLTSTTTTTAMTCMAPEVWNTDQAAGGSLGIGCAPGACMFWSLINERRRLYYSDDHTHVWDYWMHIMRAGRAATSTTSRAGSCAIDARHPKECQKRRRPCEKFEQLL